MKVARVKVVREAAKVVVREAVKVAATAVAEKVAVKAAATAVDGDARVVEERGLTGTKAAENAENVQIEAVATEASAESHANDARFQPIAQSTC